MKLFFKMYFVTIWLVSVWYPWMLTNFLLWRNNFCVMYDEIEFVRRCNLLQRFGKIFPFAVNEFAKQVSYESSQSHAGTSQGIYTCVWASLRRPKLSPQLKGSMVTVKLNNPLPTSPFSTVTSLTNSPSGIAGQMTVSTTSAKASVSGKRSDV